MKRIIIAGGREFTDKRQMELALEPLLSSYPFSIEIVSGGARGADRLGEKYAKNRGLKLTVMPADWDKYGKRAGPKRNLEMAKYADVLVAFWDGKSTGTRNMINQALQHGLGIHVYRWEKEE